MFLNSCKLCMFVIFALTLMENSSTKDLLCTINIILLSYWSLSCLKMVKWIVFRLLL